REKLDYIQIATCKPRGHHARVETSVRNVAAPAAGNAHLGEESRPFLQHRNVGVRRHLCAFDGREKTGGATAHHNDSFRTHPADIIQSAINLRRRVRGPGLTARLESLLL